MKEAAARSTFWSVMELVGGQGLSFVTFLILARILRPEDYGVMTLAYAAISIAAVVLVQGFADALVQRPEIDDAHISTALWCNLAVAAVLVAITLAGADAAGRLVGEPDLGPVLRWLSLHLVFTAVVSIPSAIYRRHMRFRTFAVRTVAGGTAGGVVGIAMAATGWGVWALVGNQICQGAVSVVIIWWGFDWPGLRFSVRAFQDLYRFSGQVMLANLVGFAASQVDRLAIGVFLDARSLGYYYLAMRLFTMAGELTHNRINEISLPVLSRMQDEPERFASTYVSLVWTSTATWFPLVTGLGLLAPLLVPTIFGPHWEGAVPLVQVMSLMCFTCPLVYHTSRALLGVGRADVWRNLSLIQLVLAAAVYGGATYFGVIGVGVAFAGISLLIAPLHFWVMKRYAGVPPFAIIWVNLTVYAAGAIMSVAVLGVIVATPSLGAWTIPLGVCIGGMAYGLALRVICPARVAEILDLAARIRPAWLSPGMFARGGAKAAE